MDGLDKPIEIAVAGAQGKMGREAVQALTADNRFKVTGVLVRPGITIPGLPSEAAFDDPEQLLLAAHPDVWLDLTDARSVRQHVSLAISYGVRPVIGSTGYDLNDVSEWDESLRRADLGGIAAPNFAIGALLMMRFAEQAARHFHQVEIIELHHDGKRDKPSGTAKRTAESIAGIQERTTDSIAIHSVRLPGLVAHQEVLFGGVGEVLTIRHDSLSRQSFMPGIQLACARVMELRGLVYGLEHLLW